MFSIFLCILNIILRNAKKIKYKIQDEYPKNLKEILQNLKQIYLIQVFFLVFANAKYKYFELFANGK